MCDTICYSYNDQLVKRRGREGKSVWEKEGKGKDPRRLRVEVEVRRREERAREKMADQTTAETAIIV